MGSFGRWIFDVFKQLRKFYKIFFFKLNNVIFNYRVFINFLILSFFFIFKLFFFRIEINISHLSIIKTIMSSREKRCQQLICKEDDINKCPS